jgi:hypothetical protein
MEHSKDCRWQITTLEQCEYRDTHHYCPHPEHACTCPAVPQRIEVDAAALKRVLAALAGPPHLIREIQATRHLPALGIHNPFAVLLAEYEAWERAGPSKH